MSTDLLERLADKMLVGDGCWEWTGAKIPEGYGAIKMPGRSQVGAHRVVYELLVGPIPKGMQLDHLCRNTSCVNPGHLEPVSGWENRRRGTSPPAVNASATHCKSDHPFNDANTGRRTNGNRYCRECVRQANRAWRAKQKLMA